MSLRTRMLLSALLPTTLVALLLTSVFLLREIANLEQGLHTRGVAISRQMASAAEYGLFSGQNEVLNALAATAQSIDPGARGAAVIDGRGSLVARSGTLSPSLWPELGRIEGLPLGSKVLLFIEPVRRNSLPVDDIYAGSPSLQVAGPTTIGHVVVEFSLQDISAKSERLISVGILIAILGAGLGGWLALRIARGVTEPLLAANEVVERIAGGDLTARMETESAGALGSLARGINNMAKRIGTTQEELRMKVAEATLDLLREKEAAEHATIAKSHFLASASHDLRQPLHALGLLVSGLARSEVAKQEPELMMHIKSAIDTLQNLLDAILDISRLDGGQLTPSITRFPLTRVLDRLADDLSLLALQKGLQLKMRETPIWVRSDEKIIERILLNLIGNALRYTEAGGVLVSCRRRRNVVLVEVWDTGKGIAEQSRQEIFEEYVQLDNPERDRAKGLGLGLAICRRLADLLDVPIGVRSRSGRGSVFWIELPVDETEPQSVETEPDGQSTDPLSEPGNISGTVLVVDADALVRTGMEQAISSWGGTVLTSSNCQDALHRIRLCDSAPDLLICNIHLPENGDGIKLAEEMQLEFPQLAVLLVSADVSDDSQTAARRAGFSLLKEPVPPGRLRAALLQLLSARTGA